MKSWTATARIAQKRVLARLAFKGAPVQPEHEYLRVLNGFAASIDTGALPVIERDPGVAGVYPVRAAYPAAVPSRPIRETDVFAPGRPPGRCRRSPASTARVSRSRSSTRASTSPSLHPGPPPARGSTSSTRVATPSRAEPDAAGTTGAPRHRARRARRRLRRARRAARRRAEGVRCARSASPAGSPTRRAACRSTRAPTRCSPGSRPPSTRTSDGDAHDAARIALVGLVEPFASFADAPLARAAAGALAARHARRRARRKRRPGRPELRQRRRARRRAGGARRRSRRHASPQPDRARPAAHGPPRAAGGRAAARRRRRRRERGAPPLSWRCPRRQVVAVAEGTRSTALFDANGFSRVAGTAALLPAGPAHARGGAGARRRGRAGRARRRAAPRRRARDRRAASRCPCSASRRDRRDRGARALAAGGPVELARRGGLVRREPELRAARRSRPRAALRRRRQARAHRPGRRARTSEPGRTDDGSARYGTVSGSSAAAAVVAGSAALLAQARPDLDAAALRSALVAAARPVGASRRRGRARRPRGRRRCRARRRSARRRRSGAARREDARVGAHDHAPQRLASPARGRARRGDADAVGVELYAMPQKLSCSRPGSRARSRLAVRAACCRARRAGWPASCASASSRRDAAGSVGVAVPVTRQAAPHRRPALQRRRSPRPTPRPRCCPSSPGASTGRVDRPQLLPLRRCSSRALPRHAPGRHAGADQGRPARTVRVRDHRARPARREVAEGRVLAPHRRAPGRGRAADDVVDVAFRLR